jgi:hypothetical protein
VIRRIVSGGQTGVDRAALDVAHALGIAYGGWVPRGRAAEDGPVPASYTGMRETSSADPALRTVLNVRDSDATLVITRGPATAGSARTLDAAARVGRPVLHLDLARLSTDAAATLLVRWLTQRRPAILNVAGPRAGEDPVIGDLAREVLTAALRQDARPAVPRGPGPRRH